MKLDVDKATLRAAIRMRLWVDLEELEIPNAQSLATAMSFRVMQTLEELKNNG